MIKPVMLDSGPLGKIAHPRPNPEITEWFMNLLSEGIEIIIPEISDYEVRRSLLLSELMKSVVRLDELKQTLTYLPITTQIMLKAAELWAEARKLGKPTGRCACSRWRCYIISAGFAGQCNCGNGKCRTSLSFH